MQLFSLLRNGEKALDAVTESFSPRPGATFPEIRKNGLLCLGIGLPCFALGSSLIFAMLKTPGLAMLPILLSYAFMIVGAYRAVFGKTPEPAHPGELSIKRVFFAVIAIVFLYGAIVSLTYLGTLLYELLHAGT